MNFKADTLPDLFLFTSVLCIASSLLIVVLIKNYRGLTRYFYVRFVSKNNMHACLFMYNRLQLPVYSTPLSEYTLEKFTENHSIKIFML